MAIGHPRLRHRPGFGASQDTSDCGGYGCEKGNAMEYLRQVDFAAFAAAGPNERPTQVLFDPNSGAQGCTINCIQLPPGGRAPSGRHTHVFEQLYYIMSGAMDFVTGGRKYQAGPGTLVVLPAGVPHNNWNDGVKPVIHLTRYVPSPEPGKPLTNPPAPFLSQP